MITIDGSQGEGGGQVIRTSVSLAAITGSAVEITAVRARRERPGLQPQHLAAVRAAAVICGATVAGDHVGTDHFLFQPGHPPSPGDYAFDVGTAGATTLVLQTVLVPLLFADGPSVVEVIGGTHQHMAPAADYIQHVYVPALERFGARVSVEYGPAGYYPRGGGRLRAIVDGGTGLRGVGITERGASEGLDVFVVTSGLPDHVFERGAATIRELLPPADIHRLTPPAFSRGASVTIVPRYRTALAGFSSIGRPGLPMERVSEEACKAFAVWDGTGAACDEHLADQLALPAALARGPSSWTTPFVTGHLRTVLSVVERFVPFDHDLVNGCVHVSPRR